MDPASLLVVALAHQCRERIPKTTTSVVDLPQALHPKHLPWMCDRIEAHAEEWPTTKLHRWMILLRF